jgi:hypothetical protein
MIKQIFSSTTDVVPKSEVERLEAELDDLKRDTIPKLQWGLQRANAMGRDADAEIERLKQIINSYALQYGTVTDQQKVIDKAKAEVIEEIEERIATHAFTSKSEGYSDGAFDTIAWVDSKLDELKKKYTEGE